MERADLLDECPEVSRVALASASAKRDLWLAALALDGRIGRMVLGASEPMLGQVRLAWWRDQLGKPVEERPRGDVLLDLIGRNWAHAESALVALVDGWEALLSPRPIADTAMMQFAEGRAQLARGLADYVGCKRAAEDAERAGKLWAFADLARHAEDRTELDGALKQGIGLASDPLRLPRSLRPLAVIGGLARRALRSNGQAMLGDRFSPLVALRLGLIGR
ncbi:hypothetical protein [Qipengyuania qiaonensis]|uniref:Phytoene synthase n=1 Tax=Qipengyuania qiaonensis TaxID=2867240 RepID=A0ABS7J8C2_9SPHN|nr:hypothetical protein [Qipengyuania qiaonensis]MBX7481227.1 hypothetical protein [Qipengyuania qiaonensis]